MGRPDNPLFHDGGSGDGTSHRRKRDPAKRRVDCSFFLWWTLILTMEVWDSAERGWGAGFTKGAILYNTMIALLTTITSISVFML